MQDLSACPPMGRRLVANERLLLDVAGQAGAGSKEAESRCRRTLSLDTL